MQKPNFNNVLLVAGTGRNTGKTSFVCQVCGEWNNQIPLVCLKISIHFHPQIGSKCLYSSNDFTIYEETETSSDKDTSRMLRAGASKVLFIEAESENVFKAFQKALEFIPLNSAVICESGSLRKFLKPSVFIILHAIGNEPKISSKELLPLADKIFQFETGKLNIPLNSVFFKNQKWSLTPNVNY